METFYDRLNMFIYSAPPGFLIAASMLFLCCSLYMLYRAFKPPANSPQEETLPASLSISLNHCEPETYDDSIVNGEYLVLDTETNGKPIDKDDGTTWWPLPLQIAWILTDDDQGILQGREFTLQQKKIRRINKIALKKHGITKKRMMKEGQEPNKVYRELLNAIARTRYIVAHAADFHVNVIRRDMQRKGFSIQDINMINNKPVICTQEAGRNFCAIPNADEIYSHEYKRPSKKQLYEKCFGRKSRPGASGAYQHVEIVFNCFFEMLRLGLIKVRH